MKARSKAAISIPVGSTASREEIVSDVLFYSIGEGAIIIDERGYISRVNKIALDVLGFKERDLIGKWYPNVMIAEDENGNVIPNYERSVTEAFIRGVPISKRIYYRTKKGGRVAVANNVAPILVHDKPVGAIELLRDITEEMQLERAKDEFISIASHQLRTPATVVKQNLGLILEGYIDSKKKQLELLETAYEHNNSQLEIINDLLNIAQVEAQKLKPNIQTIDMNILIKNIIASQMTDYKERNISLKLRALDKPATVQADPLHLQMVFENLLNNAQKYSPPDTKVVVTITSDSKYIKVNVKDQGIGIDERDIPTLFRKFSRVDNVNSMASGTGLGLYWAKKLVELHHGEIHVTSQLDKGSTFCVTIPKERP